jgi:hypothetical protein
MSNPWARLVNNWLHDFSSGLWGSGVLMLWVLSTRKASVTGAAIEAWDAVAGLSLLMFRIVLVSLVVIAATGGLRLAYWRQATPPDQMREKRPALIGKHIVFLLVYGVGTWWASTLVWPVR